jgi:hypothetical protein
VKAAKAKAGETAAETATSEWDFGGAQADTGGFTWEDGGFISGPSHAGGGVKLEAEGGEFIVNKRDTARWLPLLRAINEGTLSGLPVLARSQFPRYASGGLVEIPQMAGAINGTGKAVTVIQHITTQDANSFRRAKDQIAAEMGTASARAIRRNR